MGTTSYPEHMATTRRVERRNPIQPARTAAQAGRGWWGQPDRDKTEKAASALLLVPMFATHVLFRYVLFPDRVWLGVGVALTIGIVSYAAFSVWRRHRRPDVTDPVGEGYEYDPRR